MQKKDQPVWFKGHAAEDWVTRFTVGNDYLWDTLLLPYDIDGTRAHARGLMLAGVLDERELEEIDGALSKLANLVRSGEIVVNREDEDCHTVVERYLTEALGATGEKIQTGRSRNDQVLAALRLFLREQVREGSGLLAGIVEGLCEISESYGDAIMPGYTHLQRAMPTTAGLWAAGFAELLVDDLGAMAQAFRRVNVSPLGSAAGYGVPFLALPREKVARDLGFEGIHLNVTAVQLSRGKIEMHLVHACVQAAATINRLASDLVLFNTAEFGFVKLPEEFCTGSSIMPQKKNPDVLELARATYHRLVAEMNLLATLPSNLPSGYHRDLQLTKEAVMRAVTTTVDLLTATGNVISGIEFDRERMRAACTPELFATAEALKLVVQGVPFREAYRRVAGSKLDAAEAADDLASVYAGEGYPGRAVIAPIRERLRDEVAFLKERE